MPPSRSTNPFPGLCPFEPSQADLFFGRDEQIEDLVDRLEEHRFVAVVGTSGSGKSSLVRAGLIPLLERGSARSMASSWRITIMRPGRNAIEELAEALSNTFEDEQGAVLDTLCASSAGLARYARQKLNQSECLLLLVDQFEELFRYREQNYPDSSERSAAFVKLLLAATNHSDHPLPALDDVPVYVVITMRSDFLGRCSQFHGLPEALNQSQYLVPRMTREEQREAIEGPVQMVQGKISPTLVQRLLNELGNNSDQLPVLQHVLMRTWEQARVTPAHGSALEINDYENVGGVKEALNRDADQAFDALPDEASRTIARRLFQRLVEPGAPDEETRRPTPLSEIVAVTARPEAKVREVINVFRSRGFLTESRDEDPIIDIAHESLIRNWNKLGEWVGEESRSAVIYRRLVDTSELYGTGESSLLVDPQLQLALNWRAESDPNEAWAWRYRPAFGKAIGFLDQSEEARRSEVERIEHQRRRDLNRARVLAFVFAVFFVIAVVAFIIAVKAQQAAVKAQQEADSQRNERNQFLYDSNIYVAQRSAEDGQLVQAQELLHQILDPDLAKLRRFEWFHLWRIVHAEDATLKGHSAAVAAVAFSHDGKIIATGSYDTTVKLWDAESHQLLVTLTGHQGWISALSFSANGKILASSSVDNTIKLWRDPLHASSDPSSQNEITLQGHTDAVRSLAFSPDGKILASCGDDATVKLWNVNTGKPIATLNGHTKPATWVDFSPNGKLLASSSEDRTIKLWNVDKRTEVTQLTGHDREVWAVAFSPDGNTLASSSDDGIVKLWDTEPDKPDKFGKLLETIEAHTAAIWSVVFSPDGQTFATASLDRTVKIWNLVSLQKITTMNEDDKVFAVAFSPNGKILASVGADKNLILWDTTAHKGYATLGADDTDGVRAIAFQPPNGELFASGGGDATVKLWNRNSTTPRVLKGHSDVVWSLTFSPDGKKLVSGSADNTLKLWDVASGTDEGTFTGHSAVVLAVAFSPDGKLIASGDAQRFVKLWDVKSHQEIATLDGHTASVRALAFSPDGTTLATTGNDKTIKLWNVLSKQIIAEMTGHSQEITSLVFSHDGKKLATGSVDSKVKVWDVASRTELMTFGGHSNFVMAVAFSPDDTVLASGGLDRVVRLWDIGLKRELIRLNGHTDAVNAIAFSPDNQMLATGSNDKTMKLWIAGTDKEVNDWIARSH